MMFQGLGGAILIIVLGSAIALVIARTVAMILGWIEEPPR